MRNSGQLLHDTRVRAPLFRIKVKHGCTWDRTGIAAHCRNTAGGRNTRPEWLKAMAEGKLDTLYAKRCQ